MSRLSYNPFREPKTRTTVATAVIVPAPLGILRVYTRRGPGPFGHFQVVTSPEALASCVSALPRPRAVVLCGAAHLDDVARVVLLHDDLFVVPSSWLQDIPRENIEARAAFAARLVAAHRRQPIQRLCELPDFDPLQLGLPFF